MISYAAMLQSIEVETQSKPTGAIIWLHGLGADGHDFEPIVPELVPRRERAWRFVFPHAPVRPVTINNGMQMRAWYDVASFDRGAQEDAAGFAATDVLVRELIDAQVTRGIAPERIVLAGFSQGGAVSLYTALRLQEKLAGVLALSCYLPRESAFASERSPANDGTPIFLAHGTADPVLPVALGLRSRDVLIAQGYRVEWHEYPMPHAVCPPEISDIRAFLARVLP
jgi:phospholipase/carboxylesterase